ncbi:MAG: lysophospholipid acyltransferase family protein [Brevinemataceae bacterium]
MAKRSFSIIRKIFMLIEAFFILLLVHILSYCISYKHIYSVSKKIGFLIFTLSKYKKQIILENLSIIYPDKQFSDPELKQIGSVICGYELRIILEMIAFTRMSFHEMISWIRIDEPVTISKAFLHRNQGFIGFTLHYGNWELLGCFINSIGIPLLCLVERQFNPFIDSHLQYLRKKLDVNPVYNEISKMKDLMYQLKNGVSVALVADQTHWFSPLFIPFFGKDAAVPQGTAALALRMKSQLFFGFTKYIGSGNYLVSVQAPFVFEQTNDKTNDVRNLMTIVYHTYEGIIKQDISNWFSLGYPRWKLTPEELEIWKKNPDSSQF